MTPSARLQRRPWHRRGGCRSWRGQRKRCANSARRARRHQHRPVVVGDIIGEGAAEQASVVGETPNVAARLQELAAPNQVVIGPLTRELIGDAFACESLGSNVLHGVAEPVPAWRVLRERADEASRRRRAQRRRPLVGRQEELGLLLRSWDASKKGSGQVVLIQGEAGIGKSRLVEAAARQDRPTTMSGSRRVARPITPTPRSIPSSSISSAWLAGAPRTTTRASSTNSNRRSRRNRCRSNARCRFTPN